MIIKIYRKFGIALLAAVAMLAACANIKAPSGGPDDKTPPSVLESVPKGNVTNFSKFPVVITFSEWVEKASVTENVKINPEAKLKFSWSGKTLKIRPADSLAANTTYCISLEPGYRDISGNNPSNEFSLVFSTGNVIDSGKISGKIFTNAKDYSMLYYKIDEINPDTLNIAVTKPAGRAKLGTSGTFNIQALRNGKYRIFLLNDRNDDRCYNEGYEEVAAACRDIVVSDSNKSNYIAFYNAKMHDKVPPELQNAVATGARTVRLAFNEPIAERSIRAEQFSVSDSAESEKIPVVSAYRSGSDSSAIFVLLGKKLSAEKSYRCRIAISAGALADSVGNAIKRDTVSELFAGTDAEETPLPMEIKCNTADSAKNIAPDAKLIINFSRPLLSECKLADIKLTQTGKVNSLAVKTEFINSKRLEIIPEKELSGYSEYDFSITLREIRPAFADSIVPDTTISINFTTEDRRLFGSLAGKIKTNQAVPAVGKYIVLAYDGQKNYAAVCDDSLGWKFPALHDGEYVLNVFFDADGDGKFDCGDATPFRFAEKFFMTERKVKVIQRWNIDDCIIDLKD